MVRLESLTVFDLRVVAAPHAEKGLTLSTERNTVGRRALDLEVTPRMLKHSSG